MRSLRRLLTLLGIVLLVGSAAHPAGAGESDAALPEVWVEAWVDSLTDPDPEARLLAEHELRVRQVAREDILRGLLERLAKERDASKRAVLAKTAQSSLAGIRFVLRHPQEGFGAKEVARLVPQLARLLASEDAAIRTLAAEGLAACGELAEPAGPALQKLLADPKPDVRAVALRALLVAGPTHRDAALRGILTSDFEVAKGLAVPLLAAGAPVAETLIELNARAPEKSHWLYSPAREAKERHKAPYAELLARLEEMLLGDDARERDGAFFTLRALGESPRLARAFESRDPELRMHALLAIAKGRTQSREAVPAIAKLLADRDLLLRRRAALALESIRSNGKVTAELTLALRDPDPEVRRAVVNALCWPTDEGRQAVPALVKATADPDLAVRAAAIRALGKLGADPALVLAPLQQALDAPEWSVRQNAVVALGALGKSAAPATGALIRSFEREDARARIRILDALAAIGATDPAVLRAADERLDDPDSKVVGRAMKLLADAGAPAVPLLRERMYAGASVEARRVARETLYNMGAPALTVLVEYERKPSAERPSNEKDPHVTVSRLSWLMVKLGADAIPQLEALRGDTSPIVSEAATHAVAQLERNRKLAGKR